MSGFSRGLWILAFFFAVAGCGSAPQPAEESVPAKPEEKISQQTATQAKEAARRRRPPSYSEARERAEEKLKSLEAKKKKGEDVAARKSAVAGDAVVQKYEALLALPGTPEERKPEILLRLAEMAYQAEEAKLKQAYEAGTDMDILPGDRYPASIGYYKRLAEGYPKSSQALVAFYNLGYLYAEEGERELSVRAYREVLRRDPTTAYAAEIHMRLGESAFDLGLYKEAIVHYEAVLQGGRKEYVDKALYKLGWSHYKLDDYATAVATFSRIMDSDQATAEKLTEETVEVMGRAFVEWGGAESLARYLEGREPGKRYGDRLYKKLGDLYLEGSRHVDAIAAFTRGLDAFPLSDRALVMEESAITAYLALRDTESANTRRQLWYDRYRPGTPWDKANGAALGMDRDAMLEKGLRLAALYRHSRAQRGEGSLDAALDQYARYEELYGIRGEDGYEMAYSHAQALKEGGRHRDAARRYGEVAEVTAFTSHREDASYRRIESLDALRAADPTVFEEYVAAHRRYAELNPSSELVPKILFSLGEITFGADRFAEAREAFRRVTGEFPDHELAPQAAERIARCFFREERFAEAEEAARETLRRRPNDETREQALKLISFSIFKQAEAAEARAVSAEAPTVAAAQADSPVPAAPPATGAASPEVPVAGAAEAAAAQAAAAEAKAAEAKAAEAKAAEAKAAEAKAAEAKAAEAKAAEAKAAEAKAAEAKAAEAKAAREEAVKHFFRLAKEYPEGEAAQVSLYRAAENLRKLGKEERAAAVYRQLAEKYSDSRFAESALTLGSEILSSLGDWGGVGRNYEDLYRRTRTAPRPPTTFSARCSPTKRRSRRPRPWRSWTSS